MHSMAHTGDGITIGGIHQEVQPILFPPSISSTTLSCSRAAYPKCLHCNNRRQNSKLSKLTYPARETLWRDSVCYFKTPVHTAETSKMHCHVYTENVLRCMQCCRGQPWPSGSRQKLPIFMLTVSDREPPTCLAV